DRGKTRRAWMPARRGGPRAGTAALDRKARPLPAVRQMANGREPHGRLPRLGRLPGMAQARRPLLCFAARSGARQSGLPRILDHDPIKSNRIMVSFFRWSMIFSENRHPLFRIML